MTEYSEADIAAALEECAREPVHIPGAIQPGGCLISLDAEMGRVLQVSANLEDVLGLPVPEALAAKPLWLLGSRLLSRLRRELAGRERLPSALTENRRVDGQARRFHVTAYRSGRRVLIELEPLKKTDERRLLSAVNEWLQQVSEAECPHRLLDILVHSTRQLTRHARVMVYQFDSECHGSVVAESRAEQVSSFLGQHFPASDIPSQVRRLYDVNPVRSIADVTAAPVPLVPEIDPLEGTPLDLSRGMLRAVSPIHLTYLRSMGVGAALSIAMHNDEGRLWGLLACHSLTAGALSPAVRDAVRALVQIAMPRLMLLQARADSHYLRRVHDSRELLSRERGRLLSPEDLLQRHGREWNTLFRACGVGLVYHDKVSRVGRLPSEPQLRQIADWLSQPRRRDGVWCSSALGQTPLTEAAEPNGCCGLLAVPLPVSGVNPGWLLLFRPEHIETREWAGKPEDLPVMQDGHLVLSPRRSFAAWREEIRGCSELWSGIEQQAAVALGEDLALLVFSREIDLLNADLTAANRQLEKLAHTDTLTGAWNRYRIEQQIDAEISACERYGNPCALLLFDIDHFKQVNDRHGHQVGDQVLTTLASAVSQTLRGSDYLGRWGGEEFVVLATSSTLEIAQSLAERLRQCVTEADLCGIEPVTISIGVAAWRAGDTRRTLVERADQAMYRAKHNGRNRVRLES